MRPDLLGRLAAGLRADASNPTGIQFDLGTWGSPSRALSGMGDFPHEIRDSGVVPVSCDTQACAFGFAAISGMFKAEGLQYRISEAGYNLLPFIRRDACDGGDAFGFEAARVLFDISEADARYLFEPECYEETPREAAGEILVAERIEDFIRGEIDKAYYPETEVD